MVKKKYIQPEVQITQIEFQSMILAGSGAGSGKVNPGISTNDQW